MVHLDASGGHGTSFLIGLGGHVSPIVTVMCRARDDCTRQVTRPFRKGSIMGGMKIFAVHNNFNAVPDHVVTGGRSLQVISNILALIDQRNKK